MRELYTIVKSELKENEKIYILRKSELNSCKGIMHEFTFDQVFNNFSGKEKVVRFWHENGLCIILN